MKANSIFTPLILMMRTMSFDLYHYEILKNYIIINEGASVEPHLKLQR